VLSPVRLYKETRNIDKKTVYKHHELVNKTPAPIQRERGQSHQHTQGMLDKIRVSQIKAEQRDAKLKQNVNAQALNPDDGDHGVGFLRRKAKYP